MRSSIFLIASSAAFFSQASAGSISTRDGALAEVRFYGQPSCTTAETMGYFNLYDQDIGKCHTFPTDKSVKSLYAGYFGKGCTLEAYTDKVCSLDRHDVKKETCMSGVKAFGSYKLVCPK
ncbi:putative ec86 protein [Fusarium austroafricanum]|uniref:Putative ec86 protein n=1 Tax=Fusarium austroafricanum TaxID=2364996 RepID=A0A8H4P2F4_9HYPO|nr:putative ec86 protein [Fusarium austroafricanum]